MGFRPFGPGDGQSAPQSPGVRPAALGQVAAPGSGAPPDGVLGDLLHFMCLQAFRAHECASGLAVQLDAHLLYIGVPAPRSSAHGVASVVAESGLLAADNTNLGHLFALSRLKPVVTRVG